MDTPRVREAVGSTLENITDQIETSINSGKFTLAELQKAMVDKTKEAARNTDKLVHENPWTSIGIAAGIGLVIGLLLPRGRD
jgi:ElaB/YqjD/DUF883 family membrane-anchored ribosome-binding protein